MLIYTRQIADLHSTENDETFEDAPLDFDPAYPPMDKWTRNHPHEQILDDPQVGVLTRARICAKNEVLNIHQEFFMFNVFISRIEPNTIKIAIEDQDCIVSMQSELAKFERNKVRRLVPKPKDVFVIGLKWIFFKIKLIKKVMLLEIKLGL